MLVCRTILFHFLNSIMYDIVKSGLDRHPYFIIARPEMKPL